MVGNFIIVDARNHIDALVHDGGHDDLKLRGCLPYEPYATIGIVAAAQGVAIFEVGNSEEHIKRFVFEVLERVDGEPGKDFAYGGQGVG